MSAKKPHTTALSRRKPYTKKSLSGIKEDIGFADWTPGYKLATIVGVLGVVGVGAWAIRRTIQARKADVAQAQALTPKSHANWATRLNAAFYNSMPFMAYSGTDERAIWAVVSEMRTQEDLTRTGAVYATLYPGRSLNKDLLAELGSGEFQKLTQLMARKPLK